MSAATPSPYELDLAFLLDRGPDPIRRPAATRDLLAEARLSLQDLKLVMADTTRLREIFELLLNFPLFDLLCQVNSRLPVMDDPRFRSLWERRSLPDLGVGGVRRLAELPEHTLGGAYARWYQARALDDAFFEYLEYPDTELKYLAFRTLVLHDLCHFLLGYEPFDPLGEMQVEAFLWAQTAALNHFIFLIGWSGHLISHRLARPRELAPPLACAARRGRRSSNLLLVEWQPLLTHPLHQVRAELGLTV